MYQKINRSCKFLGIAVVLQTIILVGEVALATDKCVDKIEDVSRFTAAITTFTKGADFNTCSGFYIRPNFVLTAAHCVEEPNQSTSVRQYDSEELKEVLGIQYFDQDIALLRVPTHSKLKKEDFNCIELKSVTAKTLPFFTHIFGLTPSFNFDVPWVTPCFNFKISDGRLVCGAAANVGQSGSALLSWEDDKNKIRIFGVVSSALNAPEGSQTFSIPVDEVIQYFAK